MKDYQPTGPGSGMGGVSVALRRVLSEVERLNSTVTALTGAVETIREDVAAHSRTLTDLATTLRPTTGTSGEGEPQGPPEPARPVDWITVTDPAVAVAVLADLVVWVATVWTRYTPVTSCWAWHPPVIAELLSCRGVWVGAVEKATGPEALAAWHDRWRPATADRVTRALIACERAGVHTDPTGRRWRVDPAVVDELAHTWAATPLADRPTVALPGLTPDS